MNARPHLSPQISIYFQKPKALLQVLGGKNRKSYGLKGISQREGKELATGLLHTAGGWLNEPFVHLTSVLTVSFSSSSVEIPDLWVRSRGSEKYVSCGCGIDPNSF